MIEKFNHYREYFTKNGERKNRRKIPKERDYLIASWSSPHGSSLWISGGGGISIDFKNEDELLEKIEIEYASLNRDYVFYSAAMEWLGKMNRNYSQAERIDWPVVFEDPKDLIVPFNEWAFVKFTVQGEWEKETNYLGVTDDGRLGLFEAKSGLYLIAPLIQNIRSGEELYKALDKMKADDFIKSLTTNDYSDEEECE